jgi:hypothetical protein
VRGWSRLAAGTALAVFAPLSAGLPPLVIELVILAVLAGQTILELRLPPCPHLPRQPPTGAGADQGPSGPSGPRPGMGGGVPHPAG